MPLIPRINLELELQTMKKENTYEKINFLRSPRKKGHLPFLFSLHAKPTSNSLLNRTTPTSQYRNINSTSSLLSQGCHQHVAKSFPKLPENHKIISCKVSGKGWLLPTNGVGFPTKGREAKKGGR